MSTPRTHLLHTVRRAAAATCAVTAAAALAACTTAHVRGQAGPTTSPHPATRTHRPPSPGATSASQLPTGAGTGSQSSASNPPGPTATASSPSPAGTRAPIFAIYYLWWDRKHWVSRLGPQYPTAGPGYPLPATLDSSGCGTTTTYAGNVETDVSQGLAYDQSNPATIEHDVRLAAQAGLDGLLVNWVGTGQANQSRASSAYNTRLGYVFDAVRKINAAGTRFSIVLNYQSSAKLRSVAQFTNDLTYFAGAYASDGVLDHSYSALPEVVMAGTWKYSDGELAAISGALRSRLFLIGDEKPSSWDAARDRYLDGTSYYWSSENPVKNPSAGTTLQRFAARVRQTPNPDGSPKVWLAPFTPGYNAMLLYRTSNCVPRDGGQTMRSLFAANAPSHPDGWTFISWNEISEGTYVVPLSRYGSQYVDVLGSIARSNH